MQTPRGGTGYQRTKSSLVWLEPKYEVKRVRVMPGGLQVFTMSSLTSVLRAMRSDGRI